MVHGVSLHTFGTPPVYVYVCINVCIHAQTCNNMGIKTNYITCKCGAFILKVEKRKRKRKPFRRLRKKRLTSRGLESYELLDSKYKIANPPRQMDSNLI